VALEKSKELIRPALRDWLRVIATTEALGSLATLKFNNQDYAWPSISHETIHAKDMGHPLIASKDRINNDIDLKHRRQILLITGSNMAGKSTFLRSVGVNLVLANAGAPVCARQFSFVPKPILTSMRVADALEEGASSFYAELDKLKVVIDAVKGDKSVVFLLDEILKGTNSGDRNRGSEALLRQLLKYDGVGLVATHDLALTTLEQELSKDIENWYFDVVIENEKLTFDYRIKRGICQSFNATILMKQMGIEMD
jgi:DNA mismatch repair ATPase MutS